MFYLERFFTTVLTYVSSEYTWCCEGFTAVHTFVWTFPAVYLEIDHNRAKNEQPSELFTYLKPLVKLNFETIV